MGIFDMFGLGQNDQKAELAAEKRQMGFQREQNTMAVVAPEEQTEIINQEGKSDLLRWQQDLDPELEKLAFRFTGWVRQDGNWIKTDKKPLCNNRFMNDVVAPQLEPYLTKNLINSNLTEDIILQRLKLAANRIAANLSLIHI